MTKKRNLLIKVLLLSMVLFVFGACKNSLNDNDIDIDIESKKTYTITGNVNIDDKIFDEIDNYFANITTRTGLPSIPEKSTLEFSVYATNLENRTIEGEINNEKTKYTIILPEGTWTITIIAQKDGKILFEGNSNPLVINGNAVNSPSITLKPTQNGTGSIELLIEKEQSISCTKIEVILTGSESNTSDFYFDENTVKILFDNILSGTYNIKFNFYDGDTELIFTHFDSVNIYDGLTTNFWSGNNYLFEDGEYKFLLTQQKINFFKKTTFYVNNSTGNDENIGSFKLPFATIQKAIDVIDDEVSEYTIFINGDFTLIEPLTISKSVKITKYGETAKIIRSPDFRNDSLIIVETGATLTISDIVIDGEDTELESHVNGGGIYVNQDGTLNLKHGAIIQNCMLSSNSGGDLGGGGVYLSGGKFTMSGGAEISNCTGWCGGGVQVGNGSTFTMTGGTIKECNAGHSGGGVWVAQGSTFELSGGTIESCSAESEGGGVHVTDTNNPCIFTMTGDATIRGCSAINGGGGVSYGCGVRNSQIDEEQFKFLMTGGTITECYSSSNGGAINLYGYFEMTGGTISANSADQYGGAVYIRNDNSAFMMSCETTLLLGNTAIYGGAVCLSDSTSKFFMNGGVIDGTYEIEESATDGSGVYLTSGSFEMTSGTIQNCKAYLSGGGVWMKGGSSFTMSGNSKISNCTAICNEGGGVHVTDESNPCSFTMKDNATITGCSASIGGGGVSYGCGTTNALNQCFSMEGGTISNCSSSDGGGVYLYGNFIMKGGSISGCKSYEGAGVYIRHGSSSFTMEDGSISDNKASGKGGGVYLSHSSSSFTMNGGVIGKEITENDSTKSSWEYAATGDEGKHSNYAGEGGGGIYAENGTVSIEGGKISYNYVPDPDGKGDPYLTQLKQGGGIFIEGGTLTLKNAEVSYNRGYQGGGVRCSGTDTGFVSELKLDNATIKGNVGKYRSWSNFGGGLVIRKVNNVDFGTTPSIIEENYSADGGAVFIEDTTVTLNNITIQNNKYDTEGYRYGSEVLLWDNANVSINESPDNVKIASNEGETQGICIHADSNGQTNTLNLSGDAKLDAPIYLVQQTKINITGDLTADKVATITPSQYEDGIQVLTVKTDSEGNPLVDLTDEIISKFSLTQPDDESKFVITQEGTLRDNSLAINIPTVIASLTEGHHDLIVKGECSDETYDEIILALNENENNITVSLDLSRTTGLTDVSQKNSSFENKNLTKLILPNNLEEIGMYAFYQCTALVDVYIPKNIIHIEGNAFGKSNNIIFHVDSENPIFSTSEDGVILYKTQVDVFELFAAPSVSGDVIITEGVTSIGMCAFENCTSLTSVYIPSTVTNIGDFAFGYCSSIQTIEIPDSVRSIGGGAFKYCTNLQNFDIPNGISTIELNTFYGCSNLQTINIPNSVKSISDQAFIECSSLQTINIPNSVKSIGDLAFMGCSSLQTVYYGGTEDEWNRIEIGSRNNPLNNAKIIFAEPTYATGITFASYDSGNRRLFHIYNSEGLATFRNIVNGTLKSSITIPVEVGINESDFIITDFSPITNISAVLMNDIDLVYEEWTPIGKYTNDSNAVLYSGIFDGNGKTITFGTDTSPIEISEQYAGLFANVSGTIKQLVVQGSISHSSSSPLNSGGIIAVLNGGTIENCINKVTYSNSSMSGTGGIVGYVQANGGTIQNCINFGNIGSSNSIGGILGSSYYSANVIIQRCINIGTISGNTNISGILGSSSSQNITISDCLNLGEITANNTSGPAYASGITTPSAAYFVSSCINVGKVSAEGTSSSIMGGITSVTSYNTNFAKNYYNLTINSNVTDSNTNGVSGKTTAELCDLSQNDLSDNWLFEAGRYPLPDIGSSIPGGEEGGIWQGVITAATPQT